MLIQWCGEPKKWLNCVLCMKSGPHTRCGPQTRLAVPVVDRALQGARIDLEGDHGLGHADDRQHEEIGCAEELGPLHVRDTHEVDDDLDDGDGEHCECLRRVVDAGLRNPKELDDGDHARQQEQDLGPAEAVVLADIERSAGILEDHRAHDVEHHNDDEAGEESDETPQATLVGVAAASTDDRRIYPCAFHDLFLSLALLLYEQLDTL